MPCRCQNIRYRRSYWIFYNTNVDIRENQQPCIVVRMTDLFFRWAETFCNMLIMWVLQWNI